MTNDQQAELESYRRAAREYHESVERRLADLERRLGVISDANYEMYQRTNRTTIEMGDAAVKCREMLESRIAALEAKSSPQPLATSTSRCVVTEAQVERWERIERAADAVFREWKWCHTPPAWWTRVHEALGEALKP